MDPNLVLARIMRLIQMDVSVFDEVRDDARETIPALVVAAIACVLAGLGAFLWWKTVPDLVSDPGSLFLNTVILGSIFLFVGLIIAVAVAYVVLAQQFRLSVSFESLLRTMGYAAVPLALSVLMLIPSIYPVFALLPLVLTYVLSIYAVQSASNGDSKQVIIACTAGFAAMFLVLGFIATTIAGDFDAPMGAGQFGLYFQ